MKRENITIQNKLGLHARAAMKLVDTASRHSCEIILVHNNREIDAKDIMMVLALGASQGTVMELITRGDGFEEAFNAVESLINDKFGEGE